MRTISVIIFEILFFFFFFFKQKTAYEMRISDWSSDVCSSDLLLNAGTGEHQPRIARQCGVLAGHVAAIGRKGMGTVAVAHPFDQHRQTLERRLIGGAFPCIAVAHHRRAQPVGIMMQRAQRRALGADRSEEHTSELQSLMRISYA